MTIVIAILVFSVIIIFHELGHFLVARSVGIDVEEFSIGFGPKLTGFRAMGTQFSVRLIPMGGYVKMLGEDSEEDGAGRENAGSYQNKTPLQRMAVIAAGPLMNFVLALLIFIIIFGVVGVTINEPTIGEVLPGTPAEQAGLQAGDEIISIDSHEVEYWTEVSTYIRSSEKETLIFLIRRNDQVFDVEVEPRMGADYPEVGISPPFRRYSMGASIVEGFKETYNLTVAVLNSLVGIITRQIPAEDLTGPIGIVYFVGQAARAGLVSVLTLAALISVNLALFNLLPIPALDGSKLVFLGIELIRRRPLDPNKENLVHLVGFALLIALMLIVMYRDIIRFIL